MAKNFDMELLGVTLGSKKDLAEAYKAASYQARSQEIANFYLGAAAIEDELCREIERLSEAFTPKQQRLTLVTPDYLARMTS